MRVSAGAKAWLPPRFEEVSANAKDGVLSNSQMSGSIRHIATRIIASRSDVSTRRCCVTGAASPRLTV